MRYLIGAVALALVAVGVAALLLLQHLVDEARLERLVTTAIGDWSGREVAIEGIAVALLPRPLLTFDRLRLGRADAAVGLVADRLDLDAELLPLLAGRLEVTRATLVRPRLWAGIDAGAALEAGLGALTAALAAGEGSLPISELRLVDGVLAAAPDAPPLLQSVGGRLWRDGVTGSSRLVLSGRPDAPPGTGPVELTGQLGRAAPGRPLPLQLGLRQGGATDATAADRLEFRGHAEHQADGTRLAGRLELSSTGDGSVLAGLAAALAPDIGVDLAAAGRFALAADLVLDHAAARARVTLDDAVLEIAGQSLTGAMALATGASPELDLRLSAERLDLDRAGAGDRLAGLHRLAARLPAATTGRLALDAGELDWQGQRLRQLSLAIRLDGAGRAEIERARAVLPGPGDLAFTGRLTGLGTVAPRLAGRIELALQDPAELVASLITPPAVLARSRTMALEGELEWGSGELTLTQADLRLDTLQAQGALAWRAAAADRLARVAVRAELDRLALDDVVDVGAPRASLDRLLSAAASTDLAFDLKVERASLGDTRLGRLVLVAESAAGALRLERLALADIAGSGLSVAGTVDAGRAFDLALALDVASAPRLLRLAGHEAPAALALLGPLNLRATLAGDPGELEVAAELEADLLTAGLTASLADWQARPAGTLELTLDAGDTAPLLRQLGGVPITSPLLAGPLTAALALSLDDGTPAAAQAELGLGTVVLGLAYRAPGRNAAAATGLELTIGPLDAATAAQLYAVAAPLAGLLPGPPARWLGHWPAAPLDWGWLDGPPWRLGLELRPADPALPPLRVDGRIGQGKLTVPAFAWEGAGGRIDGAMALERLTAERVVLALDLALEGLTASAALAALGIEAAPLNGRLDLEARLRTNGRSIRQLVGELRGTADLVLVEGSLQPPPPARVDPPGPLEPDLPGIGPPPSAGPPGLDAAVDDGAAADDPPVFGPPAGAGTALPVGPASAAGDSPVRFERLEAALAISRGVVHPAAEAVDIEGAGRFGQIAGYADLLAWMLDLELSLASHEDGEATRWRLFGPLDAPEILPAVGD